MFSSPLKKLSIEIFDSSTNEWSVFKVPKPHTGSNLYKCFAMAKLPSHSISERFLLMASPVGSSIPTEILEVDVSVDSLPGSLKIFLPQRGPKALRQNRSLASNFTMVNGSVLFVFGGNDNCDYEYFNFDGHTNKT